MTASALTVLDDELAALASLKAELLASIESAKARLAEIEIQSRMAERIRGRIARTTKQGTGNDSPGATEAVLDYLRRHPQSQASEVVAAVAPVVKTSSDKRERLIYNTILGQVKKKRIIRSGKDGKELSLADQEPVERNGHAKGAT